MSSLKSKLLRIKLLIPITLLLLLSTLVEAKTPTCLIKVNLNNGQVASGSGTAYHKTHAGVYVLTCKHLTRDAQRITFQDCNSQRCKLISYIPVTTIFEHGTYNAWIFTLHPTEDLALAFIPLPGPKLGFFTLPVASFTPNPGELCCSQGHPYGQGLITLRGTILANNSLSYPLQQGMSGGGVFQGRRIVGVGVATDERSGLFVPAHVIRDFTQRAYVFQMVEGPITLEAAEPQGADVTKEPEVQGDKVTKEPKPKVKAPDVPKEPEVQGDKVTKEPEKVKVPDVPKEPEKVKVPKKVEEPEPNKELDAKLARIDKLESAVKIASTVANFAVPGAGLIGGVLGTGLGYFLRRRAKRKASVQGGNDQTAQGAERPRKVKKPRYQGPDLVGPSEQSPYQQPTYYPQKQPVPFPVVYTPPPAEQVIHTETYPTEVEVDKWSKRFAWAKAQMCQKEPGSISTLERLESLMKQCKQ